MRGASQGFILLNILFLMGCGGMGERTRVEQTIQQALKTAEGANVPTVIRIGDFTSFAWDRLYLFHPYTSAEAIDTTMGFSWPNSAKREIGSDDSHELLVFVRNGKVVQYARVKRRLGDWNIGDANGFSPRDATFEVRRSQTGSVITLHK